MTAQDRAPRLSKSRFVDGVRCHKLLWWKVHERDAPELQPNKVQQDLLDQGKHVGEVARDEFPGHVLIPGGRHVIDERLSRTSEALDDGAPAICEAAFVADHTFVAVDILERIDADVSVIEVKSSSKLKAKHIPDAAVQVHVLRESGVDVGQAEIMHLSRSFRHPATSGLFERTDVTEAVEEFLPSVPDKIQRQLNMLSGPLPNVSTGPHCSTPRVCPFMNRCWPQESDHISKLYGVGPKSLKKYIDRGVHRISDVPATQELPAAAKRQVEAMDQDRIIVEPGLGSALEIFAPPLGFLDFETVSRAIPVWDGLGPWHQATAQFSYHEEAGDGTFTHEAYLAEGPIDPRPELAAKLVEATADVDQIVMYSSFERQCIQGLQKAVPDLEPLLKELEDKLIDLHPVIRDHVYHPDFLGSFSIKAVLHPLVPDLTYNDLVIMEGQEASVEIAGLLLEAQKIAPEERDRIRQDLLAYCERDTWAMVKLLESLRKLASAHA